MGIKLSMKIAAVVVTTGALTAACGTTGSGSGGSGNGGATASTSSLPSGAKTLKIGWSNTDSGSPSYPYITDGALAAASYINATGGINGVKLQLMTCAATLEETSAQACGQQFANDKSVTAAMFGLPITATSFYPPLNAVGKAVIGGIPNNLGDFKAPPNTSFVYGGLYALEHSLAELAKTKSAKTAAVIYEGSVPGKVAGKAIQTLMQAEGIKATAVEHPEGSSNILSQVVAAGVANADYVAIIDSNCLPVSKAITQVGSHAIIAAGSNCATEQNLTTNASAFENWYIPNFARLPSEAKGSSKDVTVFLQEYPKYAKMPTHPLGTFAEIGWGMVLTLRSMLAKVPVAQITDKTAVLHAIRSYTGPVAMGQPDYKCPALDPAAASVCVSGSIIYQVKNGVVTPVSG